MLKNFCSRANAKKLLLVEIVKYLDYPKILKMLQTMDQDLTNGIDATKPMVPVDIIEIL